MIDEASRKMALVIAAKGRAAGLTRVTVVHRRRSRPGSVVGRRVVVAAAGVRVRRGATKTMTKPKTTSTASPVADPADDDAGQRHAPAALVALADLAPGHVPQDGPDDADEAARGRSSTGTAPTRST